MANSISNRRYFATKRENVCCCSIIVERWHEEDPTHPSTSKRLSSSPLCPQDTKDYREEETVVPSDGIVEVDDDYGEAVDSRMCSGRVDLHYSSDTDSEDFAMHEGGSFSCEEDTLVLTPEEVCRRYMDVLVRLRQKYCDELDHLKQVYASKKRRYKRDSRGERRYYRSPRSQRMQSSEEKVLYETWKAWKNFHRPRGEEVLLRDRWRGRRPRRRWRALATSCFHVKGNVRCSNEPLLFSKYCQLHILSDSDQVLFEPCGQVFSGKTCDEPVPVYFGNEHCYHQSLPDDSLSSKMCVDLPVKPRTLLN